MSALEDGAREMTMHVADGAPNREDVPDRPPAFHELLVRYRVQANVSRQDLAEALGVGVQAVETYERPPGRSSARTPPLDLARRLFTYYRERGVARADEYPAFAAAWKARRARRRRVAAPPSPALTVSGAASAAPPFAVPRRLTALVGRANLVDSLCALMREPDVALVTLLGVGGVGKTRVAIEVAHCLRGLFRDGAYFVDLAPVVDAGMVAATIAQHIGAVAPPAADARERLLAFLAPRNVLLVLDNFEHLLDAAPLVSEILAACAAVTALVTSRTPLSLHGEREREVPPLSVPDAADLFVQRVQDIQADFACTDENAPVIADICARLDGLPLALELAARRIKTYGSVAALLAALAPALPALVGGPRDAPARQRTMRAAIAWSYDLLRDDEQTLFRRLAVFGGGWALEAAEAVCADAVVEKDAVLDLLTELADKSLVQAPSVATPHPRYDLLETVREYGRERLDESGETATLRGRHRDWYLRLAETAEAYQSDAVWESWLDCLEADHNNLRAALAWSAAEPGGLASRLRLATALWRFWAVRGYLREGSSWLADAASLPSTISLAVRARALCAAGGLASYQASTPAQAAAAAEILNQSVTLFRQMGAEGCLGLAYALHNLGQLLFEAGDSAGGQAHLGKALALWRQLGDQRGAADTTTLLGFAALFDPTVESPIAHFGEGLRLFRAMDNKEGQANALLGLAYAHFFAGDYAAAEERIRDSLILSRDNGYPWGMATALVSYARLATATGRPERAARLYGAAEANREERNDPLPLVYQAKYEELAAPVRAAYRASWEQGRALTLDAAATEALGE